MGLRGAGRRGRGRTRPDAAGRLALAPSVNCRVRRELPNTPVDNLESRAARGGSRSHPDRDSNYARPTEAPMASIRHKSLSMHALTRILTLSCAREARIFGKSSKRVTFGELNEAERAKPPPGLPPNAERTTSRRLPFSPQLRGISARSGHLPREDHASRR